MALIPTTIYAESTPNPVTMKFVANRMLIFGNPMEFDDPNNTANSPLATKLFNFSFIKSVFIAENFVSLTRTPDIQWDDIVLELREFIRDYLMNGNPVVLEENFEDPAEAAHAASTSFGENAEPQSETDQRIIDILEEYVKPAVIQDGGHIYFKAFNEGTVSLVLQGACSGCPSSTVTLKTGIEGLLKRMVPEVNEVVAYEG